MSNFAIAIHGGCGVMAKADLSEVEWIAARADLAKALRSGWTVLVYLSGGIERQRPRLRTIQGGKKSA